ncbi:hypothetical protein Fmac_007879 [Flemingia macrophylla]|uniref:Alcohol dehydrogenase-like N-terminal domain-containing protein n=1 Tax=Flemingia macrophylla TaxID=520843 RepID=A0ABD1MVX5_9FABA
MEMNRVVESVGEHVAEVKEGDLVVPVFLANCGDCSDCKSSKSNLCTKFGSRFTHGMPRDGSSRFRDTKGEEVNHSFQVSSLSEYTVVDVTHVVKITHDLPVDKACLLSCGVSTGYSSIFHISHFLTRLNHTSSKIFILFLMCIFHTDYT